MKPFRGIILISSVFFAALFSYSSFSVADEITYDSGNRRDPFLPLIGPAAPLQAPPVSADIIIQGIVLDPKEAESLVLIKGEFYKQGDKVERGIVKKIYTDHITLLLDSKEKNVWFNDDPAHQATTEQGILTNIKPTPASNSKDTTKTGTEKK